MKSKITIRQSTISGFILGIFFLIVILLIGSIVYMSSSIKAEQAAEKRRTEFKQLGIDLADASDYLTDEARKYSITTDITHLHRYWEEINDTQTRDKVILKLKELESPETELELLARAKQHSDALVDTERRSMRLVLEAVGAPESDMVPEVASFQLSAEDGGLSSAEKLAKAREIMFDAKYDADKKDIMNPIAKFQEVMNARLESELETAREATSTAAAVQMVLALIIICAIALLIRILFKYITYPINGYTRLLRKFSFEDDKFSLAPEGTYELQQLANTFNELYFSFHEELQKRREAERTMRAAKEEAELANNAKSEFLASMSHEIRTPLNTIIGYQFLLGGTYLEIKQKEYCDKIGMVADNLLGLINGILDFSKIEAGKMTLENVKFDLAGAIKDVAGMVETEANQKGLELRLSIKESMPDMVVGDVTRLKQVMLNLLSNAIKFTERGSIDICADCVQKGGEAIEARISVKDTGIGISAGQMEIIFEHFTQGDASTSRKYGGTGLGLAISKRIVEMMKGSIRVESQEGKGSCFSFTMEFGLISNKNAAYAEDRGETLADGAFINKKILLVEDNGINLQMTKEILEVMGFEAHTAAGGLEAVELVKRICFDVILMDIRMPGMDGYEATRNIRGLENGKGTAIIALTADAVDGVAEKAVGAGMNGYLTKPLYPVKLSRILKKYISNADGTADGAEAFYDDSAGWEGSPASEAAEPWERVWERGIERLGGNRAKYVQVLEQFSEGHREDGQKIGRLFEADSYGELEELVHKLKGITGNLGANYLFESFRELEKLVKGKMPREQIRMKIEDIKLCLDELCDEAKVFIESNGRAYEKEVFQNTGRDFETVFANLYSFVSMADYEAKEYFLNNMELFEKNVDIKLYEGLKKSILEFDFEQAGLYMDGIPGRLPTGTGGI